MLSPTAELGDRRTLAYAGTLVTAGKGRGVVVATGPAAELGRLARFVEEAGEPRTPFQQAMRQLSGWLVWMAIGFSALVPALGVLVADRPLKRYWRMIRSGPSRRLRRRRLGGAFWRSVCW